MKTVAFHTLGCKLNFSETSTIARQFEQSGFQRVEFNLPADVFVVNTCSVTEQANKKCRQVIRKALGQNPDAYVIVVGCYAQLKPKEIAEIPGVDMVLGAGDKFRILELVEDFTKEDHACIHHGQIAEVEDFVHAWSAGDRTRTFLKIQDGCNYKCTFCTIPLARGRSRSDSLENILENARSIAESGVKEIVLTGVNIGDYGQNQPGSFIDVVQELEASQTVPRFRISSIEPNLLHDEIIHFVAESEHFMPHFHMPLQSGNNEMLGKMRRRYRRELYADRVALIRKLLPQAAIGVDVIVGFPGETEAHFEDTYDFLHRLGVSYLHVFTYSERENTLAAKMPGRVPLKVRHDRSRRLRMLSQKLRHHFYQQHLGESRPVLFEAAEQDGHMTGFTDNYIKVVHPFDEARVNQISPVVLKEINENGLMTGRVTDQDSVPAS